MIDPNGVQALTVGQLEAAGVTVTDEDTWASDGSDAAYLTLENGSTTIQCWVEFEGGLRGLDQHPPVT